jgi:hypothetical protein
VFDFFAPVTLPLPAFEKLVERVDDGIREHAIALVLHEDFPFRTLDILDPDHLDLDDLGIDDPSSQIDSLDQLLLFAFESAPERVIRAWAKERNEGLSDEAVKRVQLIRTSMPSLDELWNEKSNSIVPPLIGLSYDIIRDEQGRAKAATMYLSAGRISSTGRPDALDAVRLRLQLWPADIDLLIRELEHIRIDHLEMHNGEEDERDTNA